MQCGNILLTCAAAAVLTASIGCRSQAAPGKPDDASAFYDKLQREKRDVQYHGDTIRRADAGKILMCWTESKGRRKDVFGDLRIQTLTTEQLAAIEP